MEADTRILAIADIHGVLGVYDWLGQIARQYRPDLLILAGDLFAYDSEEGQREQARHIIPLLKRVEIPCYYLMGNDDNVGLDYADKQIQPFHGRRFTCGANNFVGYQYSPPFVGELFVKTENQLEDDLHSLESLLDSDSVFVTHAPAMGILDRTYATEHVGSPSLAALLDRRPVLAHIHGHIHESFGREGNHFNVASGGQKRAFLIGLPSLAHEVLQGS